MGTHLTTTVYVHLDNETIIDTKPEGAGTTSPYVAIHFDDPDDGAAGTRIFVRDLDVLGLLLTKVAIAYEHLRRETNGPTPAPAWSHTSAGAMEAEAIRQETGQEMAT